MKMTLTEVEIIERKSPESPTDLASILLLLTFRNSTAEGIPPSDINGADAARRVFERNQWMEYRNFPAEVVLLLP